MKPSEILKTAATEIETRGWAQHAFTNSDGNICAMKALTRTKNSVFSYIDREAFLVHVRAFKQAKVFLAQTLAQATGCPVQEADSRGIIMDWNDAEGRTATEVLDAFRHAAKLAREDEEIRENQ